MHGINDPEIRQRQRYADLIAGSLQLERDEDDLTPREVFERRSAIIRELRRILDDHGYVEVETPMLTGKATGAAARPLQDAPQRARYRSLRAHCAGVVFETAAGRRLRKSLRAQS